MMLRKLIGFLIILSLGSGMIQYQAAALTTTKKIYYVSIKGNDITGSGSKDAPWRTIGKAALEMMPGDKCIVRGGTYRETLAPAKSGTPDSPISFEAYPGEKVTISGTEVISGWTLYSGKIYKRKLPWDLNHDNQFFINGETMWEARWPNLPEYSMEGFRKSMARVSEAAPDSIADPLLTQPDDYWVGATLWCRGGGFSNGLGGWLAQTSKVTDFDASSHKISINHFRESYFALEPTKNNDYYLFGLLSLLDSPKEWYVDRKDKMIYIMAPDGKRPAGVEMKKRTTAIDLSNKSYIEIDGINTFAGNINMLGSSRCLLNDMDIKWLNYSNDSSLGYDSQLDNGIWITGDYNEIKNCTVEYSTGAAIKLSGSNNRIVNNYFHDIDYSSCYGASINLEGHRNLISHNTINNVGRFCIQLGGTENLIQYNDMSKFMMLSADGAAIYGFGVDGGNTRIHHNIIHDWPSVISHGIQLDALLENFIVDHNVFYNGATSPFKLMTPQNYIFVYNNTTYNTGLNIDFEEGAGIYAFEWYGDRIQNNIFTNKVHKPNTVGEYLYSNNIELTIDPKYQDPSSGNLQLKPDSPAVDAGAVIPGITDGYKGPAPDIGAYEYGGENWTAGCDFDNPPNPQFTVTDIPYLNKLHNSGFEYGYCDISGDNYVSGIRDWTCTGEKNATLEVVDQSPPPDLEWIKRGVDSKLALGGGIDGVEQVVTGLKPGTKYKLTGWTYVDASKSISFGVRDYGGSEVKVTNVNAVYQRDSIEFTTGAGNTSATVFIIKDSTGSGRAYGDDFGLVEVQ